MCFIELILETEVLGPKSLTKWLRKVLIHVFSHTEKVRLDLLKLGKFYSHWGQKKMPAKKLWKGYRVIVGTTGHSKLHFCKTPYYHSI